MRRDPWQALSDPTRRLILMSLADSNKTVNEVATDFDMSRQAISKHLKILEACNLLIMTQDGRERTCHLNARPLKEVMDWVEFFDKFWNEKLDDLENYLTNK